MNVDIYRFENEFFDTCDSLQSYCNQLEETLQMSADVLERMTNADWTGQTHDEALQCMEVLYAYHDKLGQAVAQGVRATTVTKDGLSRYHEDSQGLNELRRVGE